MSRSLPVAVWVHNPHPFLIQFSENIGIRYYGLAYLLGFAASVWMLDHYYKVGRSPFGKQTIRDLMSYLIAGVLIGGRLC
jgi:phosphatidylglycerol:prolipoprotein diacylglycerol transferase